MQTQWADNISRLSYNVFQNNITSESAPFRVSTEQTKIVPKRILMIDPEPESHVVAQDVLSAHGYEVLSSLDVNEAVQLLQRHCRDLDSLAGICCALVLPANRGLQVFTQIRQLARRVPLFLLASHESIEAAKTAVQLGADGYLLKPFRGIELLSRLEPNVEHREMESVDRPAGQVREVVRSSDPLESLIGTAPGMQKVFALIRKVAPSDVNVLITGESGSGKEMVAAAIHRCSPRAKKPFVAINCAAIPKDLLESELFGHAKGAFTGAHASRRGLFEEAHEGTVLLDEIGDLPLPLQAKILRLLQTKEVRPLGSNTVKEVNVRIISATHKNLKSLIQKTEFREDLYYRLNVMPIHLPPLRERREDIPILARYFFKKHSAVVGRRLIGFSRSALQKLQSMTWKGNVRELENTVERAMVLADGGEIEDKDILVDESDMPMGSEAQDLLNSGLSLRDIEREYIKHILVKTGNRKEAATKILGIDRKTLYRKEKLYGLRSTLSH
ncbi:MAG: sigma-54 dependent transcriptional regulator [Bdellovibrionaceae bacterium]|nr:sigma-54 dependent transcriptional regulator [Pseudobdellovibrionaceae bacterium]